MTLMQVWGVLVVFVVCPLLGGLPLIDWIVRGLTGRSLTQQGTGNVSVSAAFYHGGRWIGILAVVSEALKGIAAVLLARLFFPAGSAWEIGALMALVMGRYWVAKGAGTTNVVWGFVVHDPAIAGLVLLISGISFTILRDRRSGKYGVLIWLTFITALLRPDNSALIVMTASLAFLMGWIYTKVPDDLDLSTQSAKRSSRAVFQFFQGDRALRSLNDSLEVARFGQKAATLAHLKRQGYPVPMGWMVLPGDDPIPLLEVVSPSLPAPVVVRSSAVGEDSETASAAGQYTSVVNVTHRAALLAAITHCFESYDRPSAVQYRRDRNLPDAAMAVIVQEQVGGVFSGVAFSRDPLARQGNQVVIEALPGAASQVVSGRITPETYQVSVDDSLLPSGARSTWQLPAELTLPVEGTGDLPPRLIQQVAYLARHLEVYYHGIPQDIEWSFDGDRLWLLQSRPVTTLFPIWTRKIAAEVIPGLIRPLTWSINRPLTCGVWGEIFTIVLGDRATGLDFTATATLHYSRSYFNASLLGEIFRRMGLPPESLEFLIRGAQFSKPPLRSTLRNVPGLLRLLSREWRIEQDFRRDEQTVFAPAIATLRQTAVADLTDAELLRRIDFILSCLKVATYYSILAPLSAALRKAIAKVPDEVIDNSATPEVAALRSLQDLARSAHPLVAALPSLPTQPAELLNQLSESPAGQPILAQLDQVIEQYGYLSEVGTDIAVPTWKEDPAPIRALFAQFCLNLPPATAGASQFKLNKGVQRRFDLKGRVTEIYSRLLAELRWSFVALEQRWIEAGWVPAVGDLFYLTFDEVRQRVQMPSSQSLADLIAQRQAQLERDRQLATVPFIVYGDDPPEPALPSTRRATQQLQGIGASAGCVEGRVKIILSLQDLPPIGRESILVVPYTDSGWAPLLAQAGGLIAETGGRLSHGAIVAREYRIPAVMDVHDATQLLQDDQWVRIDGQQGIVEIL